MKNNPLVSVVIPYYRKQFFFEKTIKSILNQSYKNFEIILIYDDTNLCAERSSRARTAGCVGTRHYQSTA